MDAVETVQAESVRDAIELLAIPVVCLHVIFFEYTSPHLLVPSRVTSDQAMRGGKMRAHAVTCFKAYSVPALTASERLAGVTASSSATTRASALKSPEYYQQDDDDEVEDHHHEVGPNQPVPIVESVPSSSSTVVVVGAAADKQQQENSAIAAAKLDY